MSISVRQIVTGCVAAMVLVAGAADAKSKKKAPPPPPPPPPPAQIWVAWKPVVPNRASTTLVFRPIGPDGLRISVNRNISPTQALWNLRSGYNVAALICQDPEHAEILVNYKLFLKAHVKTLRATNTKVDAEWRAKYGAGYVKQREKFMTEVYNHFAEPPVKKAFCNAALAMSKDAKLVKSANLTNFATTALPSLEIVFDDFYKRYDQWKADMVAWEARWGKDAVEGTLVLETPQNAASAQTVTAVPAATVPINSGS